MPVLCFKFVQAFMFLPVIFRFQILIQLELFSNSIIHWFQNAFAADMNTNKLAENAVIVALFSPQISHSLAWNRTRVAAVTARNLTVCADINRRFTFNYFSLIGQPCRFLCMTFAMPLKAPIGSPHNNHSTFATCRPCTVRWIFHFQV